MKNILITGASGYIGANLSLYFAQKGYNITALSRTKKTDNPLWNSWIKNTIYGDITQKDTLEKVSKEDINTLIYLISLDHKESQQSSAGAASVNVMPLWEIIDTFSKKGLKKFIYFSTQQVYGKVPTENISEKNVTHPINFYGLTHLLCENIINYYHETTELKAINVRLSNSYGVPIFKDNNCWWLVVNDLCQSASKEQKIKLLSNGSPQRDFIYMEDICRAVEIIINTSHISDNTFHISYGQTYTILELAHLVQSVYQEQFDKKIPIILPDGSHSNSAEKFKNDKKYIINNNRIKSLGFQPQFNLEEGIKRLFHYLSTQI